LRINLGGWENIKKLGGGENTKKLGGGENTKKNIKKTARGIRK